MGRIPQDVLDTLHQRLDIVEIISSYVPVKKAGKDFKALCPFHREKTPSFVISPDKQVYYCFGCNAGGTAISFVMAMDRLTFPEAVEQLARRAGITLPRTRDEQTNTAGRRREDIVAVNTAAAEWYHRQLLAAPAILQYLAKRGVAEAGWKRFQLGYAPEGWDGWLKAAGAQHIAPERLVTAGLAVPRTDGQGWYDRFRHRLLFPILDVRGRVVSFGGRAMGAQDPKYLNGPETALYTKSHHLFGLYQAKDAIQERRTAVIVEGYMDAVVLQEHGVPYTVSPLGTALTAEQVRLLKRYADRVHLLFDADQAGEEATLRGLDIFLDEELEARVVRLPSQEDPDEFVLREGAAALERLFEQAPSIVEYQFSVVRQRHGTRSIEDKVRIVEAMLASLRRIRHAVRQREYVKFIADSLRLDSAVLVTQLRAGTAAPRAAVTAALQAPAQRSIATSALGPEHLVLALLLEQPARLSAVLERIPLEAVTDAGLREALQQLRSHQESRRAVAATAVIDEAAQPQLMRQLAAALTELGRLTDHDQLFEECVTRWQRRLRQDQLGQMRLRLHEAQLSHDEQLTTQLLREYAGAIKGGLASGQ